MLGRQRLKFHLLNCHLVVRIPSLLQRVNNRPQLPLRRTSYQPNLHRNHFYIHLRTLATMPHATEFTPDQYPPFPSSPEFKTVELETISLTKILNEDANEQDRVFEACKTRGFFYLELGGCESGETILKGADDICRMAEDFFKLPMEQKEEQRMKEGQLDG